MGGFIIRGGDYVEGCEVGGFSFMALGSWVRGKGRQDLLGSEGFRFRAGG